MTTHSRWRRSQELASFHSQGGDCAGKSRAATRKTADWEETRGATLKMVTVYRQLRHTPLKMAARAHESSCPSQDGGRLRMRCGEGQKMAPR